MMRPRDDGPEVYVCIEPVDFRKQINGLAELVEGELALDPLLCVGPQYVAFFNEAF